MGVLIVGVGCCVIIEQLIHKLTRVIFGSYLERIVLLKIDLNIIFFNWT